MRTPNYEYLGFRHIPSLFKFFDKGLTQEQRLLFMPHPEFLPLRVLIYFALACVCKIGKWHIWVASDDGLSSPLGIFFLRKIENGSAEIGLAVNVNRQKLGHGQLFINTLIAEAQRMKLTRIHLTVSPDNRSAISLYTSNGFIENGKAQLRLWNGENREEIRMEKEI